MRTLNKTRVAASAIGVFAGLGGASHGPGEMLQGNFAPSGLVIEAWPDLKALTGEPAMTVVPSFLVTGVLTIIIGVMVAWWAAKFVQRKHGGLVLILLSIIMLFVGGGLFPPVFGVAAGVIGTLLSLRGESKHGGLNA
jgi:hypothetical protein